MPRNTIVPLTDLARRPPEAGRIRMGEKSGKGMRSLDKFRFTSPQRELLDQLAARYGGTPRPWSDPKARIKSQFELYSEAREIDVYLVPDGLSIWYEAWAGGGNVRRCDGVQCEVARQTSHDEYEMVQVPCLCRAEGLRQCSPYTRLQVIIPHVSFAGVWRLETKGWNAAAELPGMYDMVVELGQRGQTVQATIGIDRREEMHHGKKRNFVVPRIGIKHTALELQGGLATAAALTSAGVATPALGSGQPVPTVAAHEQAIEDEFGLPDDAILDAEIVDEAELDAIARLEADARNFGLDPKRFVQAIRAGIDADPSDTPTVDRMLRASTRMRSGEISPVGFTPNGRVQWAAAHG